MIRVDQKKAGSWTRSDKKGECTHEVYTIQEGESSLSTEQETKLIQVDLLQAERMIRISTDLSLEVKEALINCL